MLLHKLDEMGADVDHFRMSIWKMVTYGRSSGFTCVSFGMNFDGWTYKSWQRSNVPQYLYHFDCYLHLNDLICGIPKDASMG